jgi:hypothetical protein
MNASNLTIFERPHEFNRLSTFAFRMAAAVILTVVLLVVLNTIGESGILGEPGRLLLVGMIIIPAALIVRVFHFWRKMLGPRKPRSREMAPIVDASMWPVVVAFLPIDHRNSAKGRSAKHS